MKLSYRIGAALLAAATLAGAMFAAEPAPAVPPIRVMSFNVRLSAVPDGLNVWPNRREQFFAAIAKFSPDLIGFQEVLADQYADIAARMPGYALVGVARDDGKRKGEWSLVGFRTDRFTRVDDGTFWLSEQPEVPGSKSWDAALTRICSWAKLRLNGTDREIVYANTHFDHKGVVARVHAADLITSRLTQLAAGHAMILTGDFNTTEDEGPYQALTRPSDPSLTKWTDSYREVHPKREPDEASFHAFKGTRLGPRIDFIFHSPDFTATSADIDRSGGDGGIWPSDHYPVTAVLKLD